MKDARNPKPGDKVYSTAKFLTQGIVEKVFSHRIAEANGQWIAIEDGTGGRYGVKDYLGPNDWHLNPLAAERRALDLVHAKLRSIGRQRRNLESLRDDLMRKIYIGDGK